MEVSDDQCLPSNSWGLEVVLVVRSMEMATTCPDTGNPLPGYPVALKETSFKR